MTKEEFKAHLSEISKEQLIEQTMSYFNMVYLSPNNARELHERIGELEFEVRDLEEQVETLESDLDYYGKFDEMKERIDELESDLGRTVDYDEIQDELDRRSDYDELDSRVDELEKYVSRIEDYLDRFRDYFIWKNRVLELEDEICSIDFESEGIERLRYLLEALQNDVESSKEARKICNFPLDKDVRYIAKPNKEVFHRSTCEYAKGFNSAYLIEFESPLEAMRAGYRSCEVCG